MKVKETNFEKAQSVAFAVNHHAEDGEKQLERFCKNLFEQGRDWLDVETLLTNAGLKDASKRVAVIWEDWQDEDPQDDDVECHFCGGEGGHVNGCPFA